MIHGLPGHRISDSAWHDAQVLWEYLRMGQPLERCRIVIGLGGYDIGVASVAVDIYLQGFASIIVFTGANSPLTSKRFPRGEAVHFREHAVRRGVRAEDVLIEPNARNTGENIAYSRKLIRARGIDVDKVIITCKPHMERRAFATCQKIWPDVGVICHSGEWTLAGYVRYVGDVFLVICMLVGTFQRVIVYSEFGYSVPQNSPQLVLSAYLRLCNSGFDTELARR